MSGIELIKYEEIQNTIYTIRGLQVMIDRDPALLYDVETRTLNQAVKRNRERFPDEYCFQLNDDEFSNWKSQIVMSNDNLNLKSQFATLEKWDSLRSQNVTIEGRRGQHIKYLPYAFTPKQWIEETNAIGFVSKAGRYGGTCGIAKCDTFKATSAQQVVSQLIQIPWGHNIAIIPKCGNLKEVKMA